MTWSANLASQSPSSSRKKLGGHILKLHPPTPQTPWVTAAPQTDKVLLGWSSVSCKGWHDRPKLEKGKRGLGGWKPPHERAFVLNFNPWFTNSQGFGVGALSSCSA